MLAANHHAAPHQEGAEFGYAIGGMFFGAIGFLILGAEWSIAMRPGVRRRWIGDVVRTLLLVVLLILPARDLWG